MASPLTQMLKEEIILMTRFKDLLEKKINKKVKAYQLLIEKEINEKYKLISKRKRQLK